MRRRTFIRGAAASLVTVAAAGPAQAQLGGLGGLGDKLKRATPNILGGREPITTSLSDAKWGRSDMDGFTPREAGRSLMQLQRTPNGGFVVQPGYYQFTDTLDVDRYEIDGVSQDTVAAVRELNMNQLGDGNNWNNRTAVFTHGYGLVAAAGNQRTADGEPVFLESGIPSSGFLTDRDNFEPRVYFGEYSPEYSIVGAPEGTDPVEMGDD